MSKGSEPFTRYIVTGPSLYWWQWHAVQFLNDIGWYFTAPKDFSYISSYGFDADVRRTEISDVNKCLQHATGVLEYQGELADDSMTPKPEEPSLMTFLLMCRFTWACIANIFGKNGGYLSGEWNASLALLVNNDRNVPDWAGPRDKAIKYFEQALVIIPNLNRLQFSLAIQWYLSALRELEIGRPAI